MMIDPLGHIFQEADKRKWRFSVRPKPDPPHGVGSAQIKEV